ncbi:hypothetical protein Cni_G08688 [Canna indica]|uniref:non-specific serine/threonine protein kinase n=1 Tax=Canna indica TaxID=4628 RepID=A0AAQ3K0X3_9LILI|nr:hypothetical protein Cni_G08688 [Canna indica]
MAGNIPASLSNLSQLAHLDLPYVQFPSRVLLRFIPTALGLGCLKAIDWAGLRWCRARSSPACKKIMLRDVLWGIPVTSHYRVVLGLHVLLIILSLLLNQDLPLHAGDNAEERVLLEFKKSINNSEDVLSNWNDSTRICRWIGIVCSRHGRVISLNLFNRSLHGTISPFVSNLSQLQHLDLSYNSLQGSIPVELSALRNLTILDLSCNSLHDGIPGSFRMLANLEHLNLSFNHLGGNLPASIFYNCTRLEMVDLSSNSFNGQIPPQIGNLKGLKRLVLLRNQLSKNIPASLSNISQLDYLDLSDNSLQGYIPVELGELSKLTSLDLSSNQLQHGIPDSFGKLAALTYLDLSSNQLDGKLPPSIFYNCTQLQTLAVSNNSLDGTIPQQIGNLRGLKQIFLRMNHLTGSIPASLSNATGLTTIDFAHNSLTGQLPSDIVLHLPSLMTLYISYNNLSSDEGKYLSYFFRAISNLTNLVNIGIAGNNLRGRLPSTIGLLRSLSIIFLQENKIHGTIPSNISNLKNLTLLNLAGNLLEGTIPMGLFHLPKLETTWLNNNMLYGEIPPIPSNFPTHLGVLDLSQNNLSGSIPSSISNLKSMRELQLSENLLEGLIPLSLGSMKLELLNLSHNRLTGKLPANLASLSTIIWFLDLSHNLLKGELPRGFSKMDKVQTIVLSSNKFNGSIPPDLGSCIALDQLNLSHNSLQGSIPESFGNLKNLQSLDLSSNILTGEVPASLLQCTNLKQINLSFNQFSGALPHGGVFDSLSFESLEGNHFCGSEGFSRCHSRKRRVVLIAIIIISSVLFFLAILCITKVKSIRSTALDVRHSIDLFSSHPRITYRELFEATLGFDQSRLIGSGGFSHVYRGTLSDGRLVAIKVLQMQDHNSSRTFNRECQVLKRIRHRNLIGIITTCSLPEFKALVLPLMSKGSLENHLHPQGDETSSQLSLAERVNICGDVAEGMTYLHHHAPVQVIHCDLKPSNILLSDDMTAIVSDFGIARLVSTVGEEATASGDSMTSTTATLLRGSVGYVAPEYGYGRRASTKGDVYSFGIIVLEMITGKRPTEEMFDGGLSLINWVKCHYRSQLDDIIDSSLLREIRQQVPEVQKVLEVAVMELVDLGLVCTQEAASARPTMISIADYLNKLKQYLAGDTTATFASSHGMSSATDLGDDW